MTLPFSEAQKAVTPPLFPPPSPLLISDKSLTCILTISISSISVTSSWPQWRVVPCIPCCVYGRITSWMLFWHLLIPPPPPAMIRGMLFPLTTNVPPPPKAVFGLVPTLSPLWPTSIQITSSVPLSLRWRHCPCYTLLTLLLFPFCIHQCVAQSTAKYRPFPIKLLKLAFYAPRNSALPPKKCSNYARFSK